MRYFQCTQFNRIECKYPLWQTARFFLSQIFCMKRIAVRDMWNGRWICICIFRSFFSDGKSLRANILENEFKWMLRGVFTWKMIFYTKFVPDYYYYCESTVNCFKIIPESVESELWNLICKISWYYNSIEIAVVRRAFSKFDEMVYRITRVAHPTSRRSYSRSTFPTYNLHAYVWVFNAKKTLKIVFIFWHISWVESVVGESNTHTVHTAHKVEFNFKLDASASAMDIHFRSPDIFVHAISVRNFTICVCMALRLKMNIFRKFAQSRLWTDNGHDWT